MWTPIDISLVLLVQKVQEHRSSPKIGKTRVVTTPVIDKSLLWAFFDGVSQGDPPIGGAGGVIFINETNKISFKVGLCRATNSKAELSALWATLKLAKDKQIAKLHIYGDSKTVIKWAQGKNNIRAPHLQNFLKAIRSLQSSFEVILFNHIYREFNAEVDMLS